MSRLICGIYEDIANLDDKKFEAFKKHLRFRDEKEIDKFLNPKNFFKKRFADVLHLLLVLAMLTENESFCVMDGGGYTAESYHKIGKLLSRIKDEYNF